MVDNKTRLKCRSIVRRQLSASSPSCPPRTVPFFPSLSLCRFRALYPLPFLNYFPLCLYYFLSFSLCFSFSRNDVSLHYLRAGQGRGGLLCFDVRTATLICDYSRTHTLICIDSGGSVQRNALLSANVSGRRTFMNIIFSKQSSKACYKCTI